jgi:hypothetical protein
MTFLNPVLEISAVPHQPSSCLKPLFIVVEGTNDIAFLKEISNMLHIHNTILPNLGVWEAIGRVVFIPAGGGNLSLLANRLDPLRHPEFHLYDREVSPLTAEREEVVSAINRRPGCVAFLTRKRCMENYLAPQAVIDGCGTELKIDDMCDVPTELAQKLLGGPAKATWEMLSRRTRNRLRYRAKRLLMTQAVAKMTPDLLAERDPHGAVIGWLWRMAEMAKPRATDGRVICDLGGSATIDLRQVKNPNHPLVWGGDALD